MTTRPVLAIGLLLVGALGAGSVALRAAGSDPAVVNVTPIARDGQVLVSFELAGGLTPEVQDAIQSGLPTSFSYDVELRRGTAAWFDRVIASVTVTATVRFDNLTRRYQMTRSFDGRIEDARPTEDPAAVREWMTRFERVPVSPTAALETNGEYYVRVRAHTHPRNGWFVWPWDRGAILGRSPFTFIP
jgi:hypothetical protein